LITLAVDTSEVRGSVAIRAGGELAALRRHNIAENYSSWLPSAVEAVLREVGVGLPQVDVLAAETGPGSFTGVRVGLTAVKAWSEVFGKPIVGISRLEAVARRARSEQGWVTASYDAQRGQIFGAMYRRKEGKLERVDDELVVAPDIFLAMVEERAGAVPVEWVSLDPEIFARLEGWQKREQIGDLLQTCEGDLAITIAEMAEERAARNEFTDVLQLDANYVRRSDAEIFWKGSSSRAKG